MAIQLPVGYGIERRKVRGEEGIFLVKKGVIVYYNFPRISGMKPEEIEKRMEEIIDSVEEAEKLITGATKKE
jgi:hypothetical protein